MEGEFFDVPLFSCHKYILNMHCPGTTAESPVDYNINYNLDNYNNHINNNNNKDSSFDYFDNNIDFPYNRMDNTSFNI